MVCYVSRLDSIDYELMEVCFREPREKVFHFSNLSKAEFARKTVSCQGSEQLTL
jgi:hypothetical protein